MPGYRISSNITFECDPEYVLKGSDTITCQKMEHGVQVPRVNQLASPTYTLHDSNIHIITITGGFLSLGTVHTYQMCVQKSMNFRKRLKP